MQGEDGAVVSHKVLHIHKGGGVVKGGEEVREKLCS